MAEKKDGKKDAEGAKIICGYQPGEVRPEVCAELRARRYRMCERCGG